MMHCGSVQAKVSCVFQTVVIQEPSSKRSHQPYRVVASENIREDALQAGVQHVVPSEKLDGTCVCVREFQGKPWLWARHNRRPTKAAEKRFKKHQTQHRAWQVGGREGEEPQFTWDLDADFKEVPGNWVPADGVSMSGDAPLPDTNAHIPGWVPVDLSSRQHCWHHTVVDWDQEIALILRPIDDLCEKNPGMLELTTVPLREIVGKTLELIGTMINGDPYGLGDKQHPLHCLVIHGSVLATTVPKLDFQELKQWFSTQPEGRAEGLVWHCENGQLFKLHRHHLGLPWPVSDLSFSNKPVIIHVDASKYELASDSKNLFSQLSQLDGQYFQSICAIFFGKSLLEEDRLCNGVK